MNTSSLAAEPILVVEHVDKSFPTVFGAAALLKYGGNSPRRQVLFDVNLSVKRGELFGLLGPNGAGKTTLLKMLATLTTPDRGRMSIAGFDVMKNPKQAKQRVGLCTSEERSFYFRLTARQNLQFFGALVGLYGKALDKKIDEVVEMVDLRGSLDDRFAGFSSGMRQRITVARALLADPEVLFLDEPTRAVDPVHAESLRHLIRRNLVEGSGKTVILATNLLDEAWEICDRVAVVSGGRIAACGPPRELDRSLDRVVRYTVNVDAADEALLARTRAVTGFRGIDIHRTDNGVTLHLDFEPSDRGLTDLLQALSSNGTVLREFRTVEEAPVEVFKRVTGDHGKP